MITGVDLPSDPLLGDRVLVVGRGPTRTSIVEDLRSRFPDWSIATCDSYMLAIADLADHPSRAVLAIVDPSLPQLDNAVAGLREAGGEDTKVLLCCTTEQEPIARDVLDSGADDYVLLPLDGEELDGALGYARFDQRLPSSAVCTNHC